LGNQEQSFPCSHIIAGIANMGSVEQVFVFYNSRVGVFENEKFKELSGPVLLLLEDLKNHPKSRS
jgi:hypothetical protein